ncbi:MAG: EamA family transporter [Burkholderiaceae bacterium]|nr:EamA family transporter [Burkholderiaceae bacterium]
MNPGLIFLITSVCCSVTVAVLLKLARQRGIDVQQAIAMNYAMAVGLVLLILNPSVDALRSPTTPWGILLALGVLLPAVFIAMAQAVRHAGIVRSDAAQRLSLFIPLLMAFVLFGETFTLRKVAAIALGLLALFCLLKRQPASDAAESTPAGRALWIWPLAVWLGYGVIDVLFKQMARTGTAFPSGLLAAFSLAGVLITLYLIVRRTRWHAASLGAGLILGAFNFANIYTYIRAHQSLPNDPALVFSAMNIGVISLGTLVGAFMFKERLNRVNVLGLAFAVIAVVLMTPW